MTKVMIPLVAFFMVGTYSMVSVACDDHKMMNLCKGECPKAKTVHETHECMYRVAKKKESDTKFKDSKCFLAYEGHKKQEEE